MKSKALFPLTQGMKNSACGSGGRAVERRLSTNQKIGGLIPGSSSPHVEVALGKLLNPKLLPKAVPLGMNVYEWVWMSWLD